MKGLLMTTLMVFAVSLGVKAQIKLIGASVNNETGKIDLLKWQSLDSLSVEVVPTFLDGYFFATSAFDALNSNYYITGISGDSSGLYAYNTPTGMESLVSGSLYTNVAEFDMSNGKMYNLKMETDEYINIYEYDIVLNQDSLIGTIYEPGANAIVADAIGFDSNNGIIYYVGFTNDPALCIYAIPVRDSLFSFSRTVLNTTEPINNITSVQFDNVNEIVFALNDTYDSLANFIGRNIVEIDVVTGNIINRGELAEFPYYVGGSSSFDQNTGTFLFSAIDTSNMLKMVAFNTYSDTYISGFVPDIVSEIVCDNSNFAKSTYTTTETEQELAVTIELYPNPVSEVLFIEYTSSSPVQVLIFSSLGNLVFAQDFIPTNNIQLDLSSLTSGVYVVNLVSQEQTLTEKIAVF